MGILKSGCVENNTGAVGVIQVRGNGGSGQGCTCGKVEEGMEMACHVFEERRFRTQLLMAWR